MTYDDLKPEPIEDFEATMSDNNTTGEVADSLATQRGLQQLVTDSFPGRDMTIVQAVSYKKSYLGSTTKLVLAAPDGGTEAYFLKTITMGAVGATMCEGEFEALKAFYEVSPKFVPRPISWGQIKGQGKDLYYILEEFCNMGDDLAGPKPLATSLADLHLRSRSPTGKFGFHVKTCHGPIVQQVSQWEDCWATFYKRHLAHYMQLAAPLMASAEYDSLCQQVLEKVIPRLLLPLQQHGRVLKPALLHGDCWDGNTASDWETGEALVFDACSFYGHNEYDIGNWRAPRHKVSAAEYVEAYKEAYPISEPVEEWDARNVLYSLSFNIGNVVNIAGSDQREVVVQDMQWLCANYAV